MKFNPLTNILYTDDGKLIKKMHCPYPSLKWTDLSVTDGCIDRFCPMCEYNVVETKELTSESVLKLLQEEPITCIKIDFNQENVKIVHHV